MVHRRRRAWDCALAGGVGRVRVQRAVLRVAVGWTRRRRHAGHDHDRDRWRGQLFHLYLIAYGEFRLAHEFVRDTPRIAAGLSGYQLLSIAILALGAVRFAQRHRQNAPVWVASSQ